MICTSTEIRKAPINAQIPIELEPNTAPTPRKIATVAPRDAPEEIPRIYGSAIGFFTMACITTPATARPMPTAVARRIRGRRINHTISDMAPTP